jgi:hypothetical protein
MDALPLHDKLCLTGTPAESDENGSANDNAEMTDSLLRN